MLRVSWLVAFCLSLILGFTTASCSRSPISQTQQTAQASPVSLRHLADQRDFAIGVAVNATPLRKDPLYRDLLAREFNALIPENSMKFQNIHPERDRYDFTDSDAIVTFARKHGMKVIAHAPIWFHQLPRWVTESHFSREELLAIMKDHIQTILSHYRGQVLAWDVVNEPLNSDGSLRESIWFKTIGPEYIDLAFQWAKEADPDALLYINDYAEGLNSKSDGMYDLVKGMLERGIPVDGVGFQSHIGFLSANDPEEVNKNMKRLQELGLEVLITEMDVPITALKGADREEKLAEQARLYGAFLDVCLENSNCNNFLMWGLTDAHSWLQGFTGGKAPMIFDRSYQPKPAYDRMVEVFEKSLDSEGK
ncbi:endo-1,4-beta-xylanase [Oxynema aestuarii]|jgi:endo-1,4-beta-xylanase|uniref:Beta-xylanase n=1 Tax=Oxynema aestuarii AP17 TaxID=2064643 RepID=A0A6H1TY78_9CYAN|nr:endo-1,4-beta-xylanase [Oxynema aestuarii]QIZ71568.1 endo-1,4-beta-xylanase [Oxynema aestuarii AP17]RMH72093.1 MAG: endo-1,4-beta-xylanase [Cyanobacteria bacterium J007]